MPSPVTPRLTLTFCIDERTLASVHAQSFLKPWIDEDFRALLATPGVFAVVAWLDERPVGCVMLRVAAGEAEILTICVDRPHRGIGVAHAMLQRGVEEAMYQGARELFLEVAEGNDAARGLYAASGFCTVGRRKGYYADGEDALVMRRTLAE